MGVELLILNSHGLSPLARGTPNVRRKADKNFRFIPAGAGNTAATLPFWNPSAVYPRWRGEHSVIWFSHSVVPGLSPLARGTQFCPHGAIYFLRFIPAGAGNTLKRHIQKIETPVYPRWRGEHREVKAKHARMPGLSPLARGTLQHIRWFLARVRFIPAGAGNTRALADTQQAQTVYPRWRGEHTAGV